MEEMKTIEQFIEENKISIECEYADNNPHMQDFDGDHWKVILRREGKQFTLYYSKGYGHNGAEPIIEEVLNCIALDSSGYENAMNFEDWTGFYGYNPNSREAENIYKVVERQAQKAKNFLGSELYNELLYEVEGY